MDKVKELYEKLTIQEQICLGVGLRMIINDNSTPNFTNEFKRQALDLHRKLNGVAKENNLEFTKENNLK